MSKPRVVILGAGTSSHTAALNLKRKVGKNVKVIMVSPNSISMGTFKHLG